MRQSRKKPSEPDSSTETETKVPESNSERVSETDLTEEKKEIQRVQIQQLANESKGETQTPPDAEPRTKRKYTRRAKVESGVASEDEKMLQEIAENSDAIVELGVIALDGLYKRIDPSMPLGDIEAKVVRVQGSIVLKKYLALMGGYHAELILALAIGGGFALRLQRRKKKNAHETESSGTSVGNDG